MSLYRFLLLVITMPSVFGIDSLPSGNFGHFGDCVLKFLTLNDTFEYNDLAEYLIHVNNPANLIYTVSGRLNFSNKSIEDEKVERDFRFYEVCTITVFVNFGIQDNQFRNDYLLFTRDVHRSLVHSIMIVIFRPPRQHTMMTVHKYDYLVPYRVFVVDLETRVLDSILLDHLEFKWFFYCIPCKSVFVPVRYTSKIKTLTVRSLNMQEWRNDISIMTGSSDFRPRRICRKGQYNIALSREYCSVPETKYSVMSHLLNITFDQFLPGKRHKWGYFAQHTGHDMHIFYGMNTLFSFRYEGYHVIYYNFDIWSEKSDLAAWVSPFTPRVWLGCLVFIGISGLVIIVIDLSKSEGYTGIFPVLKNVGDVIFTILAIFVRQSTNNRQRSNWIIGFLLLASLALLVQYEVHLMENLVTPPVFEKFCTLNEFFAHGYTIVYKSDEGRGWAPIRSRLQQEFNEQSLGHFPHNKTIAIRYDRFKV